MMHTTCFYSSLPLTHRPPPRSIYTDDPTYCITNPLLIQSSYNCSSCCCCCCCAANNNSYYNSLPRIANPSFLCNGLRQSTLIQFSPSRRLLVHGRIRQLCDSGSRFSSTSESDRSSCYNKIGTFKARRKLGDRRYACSSFEEKNIGQSFSNDCVDEVELLLDLLTEEVGLESISVRDRKRIQKKDPQKKDSSKISSRAKTVKSGFVKRDLKCDAKVAEVRSGEKENSKLSDERRMSVTGVNHEGKRQGSSCSSYYSVSSAGEYGSDDDIVIENDDYFVKGESSNEYKDDRRVYDEELEENVERQQEFGKIESEIVKKNTAESYYGNQEWRKKSEKKLNVESSQSQHTERNSQQHSEKTDRISYQSRSGMKNENSNTQKLYSGTENKLSTSVQERTHHQKEETVDFTRQNEYKKQSNVNLEASETHNFDKRMASSSSSSFETRMKNWEENRMKNLEESSTQVSDRFKDQREEKHQRVVQLASSKDSRKKSQQISEISDTLITNTENTSVSQTQADIRTNKQELHDQREEKHQRVDQLTSSKESRVESQQISEISDTLVTNIENTSVSHTQSDIRTKKQELHLESSSSSQVAGPTETMKTGRKTTKASSFHVGMPKESSSSYKALKLNPESSFQETGTHIASADEQQKSAGQFVGEFVEKAKHQLSISEVELAREDDAQHELKSSGESGSGNYDEKDGDMGPSDEVWHESGAPGNTSSDEQAKRSGRSLWNVIGDVVRLRWGSSRSETHTPKSGGVSNQSTSSERWFSGHEPDESSRKEVSTPSSFKEKQDSPLSPLIIEESSIPLPAIRMRRSPIVKSTSVTGETVDQIVSKPLTQVPHADASGSGKTVTVEPPPNPSRRKLARTDQVSKDRFDEWEEAYTIEAKQRKNDEFFMREALSEAKKAADMWEVPVGAVLVQDGKIIARGYNLVEELRDSTAHAEMICIREASNKLHSWRLSGTTLYVTLEPCPMCAGAILQARIDTIVWGAPNKLLGADGSWIRLFPDVGGSGSGLDKPPAPVHPFHPNMIIRRGVLSSECADVMQQFFQLRRKKKDKKPEAEPPSPPQPSCLPIPHHHNSKLVTKLHDVFGMMFCL
ncbi:putative tRNA(adenine(34)) deaminase [Helianthus annuus]|uniref:tRNA(adenine(34)) deaminase n=1 Tax=Helianthus annuus TaxID=4232 RepID=A0A9K3DV67_HELAN|nr:tRNA(adenine(34)) deaminase, chloroplastic [Helianthus annuus]KAF5762157.1 putative tRNA(adenine(34)) deaminase [Helianthus annuus]